MYNIIPHPLSTYIPYEWFAVPSLGGVGPSFIFFMILLNLPPPLLLLPSICEPDTGGPMYGVFPTPG